MNLPLTPDSVPSTLSPGTRFGIYEILQQLGAGGMGEVYRAKDTRLNREVAIKTLSLDRLSQPEALARLEKEARSACALNHPNIVTIYELGQVNGTRYIAMELVDGETVREMLSSGPIPFRKAVTIAAQIADALAKAHEIGIVHRDLKPENLMVSGGRHGQGAGLWSGKTGRGRTGPRGRMLRRRITEAWNGDGHRRLHVAGAGNRRRS